jgi:SPP1 gp7 family putative phage head morphogenesis protein
MSFRASKKREKRKPEPIAQGTQLIASAPIRNWYDAQLKALVKAMMDDYREELVASFDIRPVARVFKIGDASAAQTLQGNLNKLNGKWHSIFQQQAKKLAKSFVDKVDDHSKATVRHSLGVAGVTEPRMAYTSNVENTLESSIEFNNTLITGLQADAHEKIFNAVMLSLSSPNPEDQGIPGIMAALDKTAEITGDRAKLIARDQNSKVYSSLNVQRMKDNGIEKFRWIHSSAGKVPRPSHVERDMEIFTMDDPRLWEGPKSDQGPPGWAINCRCRAVPVFDID